MSVKHKQTIIISKWIYTSS